MKIHLNLDSGIAGNMFLAACLDVGLEREGLEAAMASLGLTGWTLEVEQTVNKGIAGTHLDVACPPEHAHRHLPQILAMIHGSTLSAPAKALAERIFRILAEAEGTVHGVGPEQVHFHEVGAVDSIIDICGAAYAYHQLEITRVTASPLCVGSGYIHCDHGRMPVPVPAVAEILRRHHIPLLTDAPPKGELVTPTGAAILAAITDAFGPCPLERIDRIGYGLGTRRVADRANAVRLLVMEEAPPASAADEGGATQPAAEPRREQVGLLSARLEEMNPEWFSPLWQKLFDAGALDVSLLPLSSAAGRPAVRLEVVTPPGQEEAIARLMMMETAIDQVRLSRLERLALPRVIREVPTPWGTLRAKAAGGVWRLEYEDLAALAHAQGWPLPEAHQRVLPHLARALEQQEGA